MIWCAFIALTESNSMIHIIIYLINSYNTFLYCFNHRIMNSTIIIIIRLIFVRVSISTQFTPQHLMIFIILLSTNIPSTKPIRYTTRTKQVVHTTIREKGDNSTVYVLNKGKLDLLMRIIGCNSSKQYDC